VWKIEFYRTERGRYPVVDFIDSLDAGAKARLLGVLDLLEEFGINLRMPYARHVEKQLWELRARHGRNRYRIIYFLAFEDTFMLLHGFTKKTDTIPAKELKTARLRLTDFLGKRRR
jgi:phage-related protein